MPASFQGPWNRTPAITAGAGAAASPHHHSWRHHTVLAAAVGGDRTGAGQGHLDQMLFCIATALFADRQPITSPALPKPRQPTWPRSVATDGESPGSSSSYRL